LSGARLARALAPGTVVRGLALGVVAALWACAHAPQSPGAAAAAFGAAIARGDTRAAYALTSAEFRKRTPFEAFAASLGADPAAAKAFGGRLDGEAARLPARVELRLSTGEPITLVAEDGAWRVDGPAFDPWGQATPRAALRTFIRALDERRYDVLLRLAPNRYRGDLSADKLRQYWEEERKDDHLALLARLRAAADAPIVESGDEAHMPYGPEQEVRFVREDGRWKVASPD
jgi:hypothetical protein